MRVGFVKPNTAGQILGVGAGAPVGEQNGETDQRPERPTGGNGANLTVISANGA